MSRGDLTSFHKSSDFPTVVHSIIDRTRNSRPSQTTSSTQHPLLGQNLEEARATTLRNFTLDLTGSPLKSHTQLSSSPLWVQVERCL
jgi:hypothetical protein